MHTRGVWTSTDTRAHHGLRCVRALAIVLHPCVHVHSCMLCVFVGRRVFACVCVFCPRAWLVCVCVQRHITLCVACSPFFFFLHTHTRIGASTTKKIYTKYGHVIVIHMSYVGTHSAYSTTYAASMQCNCALTVHMRMRFPCHMPQKRLFNNTLQEPLPMSGRVVRFHTLQTCLALNPRM